MEEGRCPLELRVRPRKLVEDDHHLFGRDDDGLVIRTGFRPCQQDRISRRPSLPMDAAINSYRCACLYTWFMADVNFVTIDQDNGRGSQG